VASLVVWSGTIVYCYVGLDTTSQAAGAAAVTAMVGGSQALSRSLFS